MLLDEQKSFDHPLMTKISLNHSFIVRWSVLSDTLCFWVICDTQIFHCRENESGYKVIMFVSGILLCFQDIPGYFHTSTMFWGPLFACKMAVFTWKANNLINNGSVFILGYRTHSAGARPLWVLEKHLLYDSCPSLLQFLSSGSWMRLLCRPLGLSASLCRTAALLHLLGSGFLTKLRHGDRVSARRKRGSIFSHSAHSRSGSPGKNSPHPRICGCATTRVGHGPVWFPEQYRKSPWQQELHPFSSCVELSGKRKNPNNSAKGQGCLFHYCFMKISPGYLSIHTCALQVKQNSFKQSRCMVTFLKVQILHIGFFCLFLLHYYLISPFVYIWNVASVLVFRQ